MKGILSKTENGWVVNYHFSVNNNDWETLPLHPEFIEMMDTCFTSKFTRDVDFEIVTETYEDGKGCTYAKLIHHSVDTTKMINHIVDTNEMVCMFEPRTDTSSATVCKHCGQEKFLHNQVPDVRKMVSNVEIGKKRWDDWDEFNKKACYPEDHQSAFADGFTRGAKWVNEIAKETLYTEEQVREAIDLARETKDSYFTEGYKRITKYTSFEIIQSLKQPKP
jgi:hypothetical protein